MHICPADFIDEGFHAQERLEEQKVSEHIL